MANIPKKVIYRFSQIIGKYQKILKDALNKDVNEADTVVIIIEILSSVFGFDKFEEITSEFAIRHTYCDLAVKVDGKVKFLFEVKAIGISLDKKHIKQAIDYGANQGIDWVVLTNGVHWMVYKISFGKPIDADLICDFNFLEINLRKESDQEQLFILCKEGLGKEAIEEFHEYRKIVNRYFIGAVLLNDAVRKVIIKELKAASKGLKVEDSEIENILKNEVLKREVIDGGAAERAHERYKKASKKGKKAKAKKKKESIQMNSD